MNQLSNVVTINSLELAAMVSKEHKNVMQDIRKHNQNLTVLAKQMEELGQLNFQPTDYFIEGSYLDRQNRKKSCFHVTKLGCDYYANKMTGTKGAEFTVKYMQRFEEMKLTLSQPQIPVDTLGMFEIQLQAMKEQAETIRRIEKQTQENTEKITDVLDQVKLTSRQVKNLTDKLVSKLSKLCGHKIKASDYQYIIAKKKLFSKYRVSKWEDIPVSEYHSVFADIDSLEDIKQIEF